MRVREQPAGVQAEIDLPALAHNLQQVKKAAPDSRVLAVIKANGYGHGMLRVARALAAADAFAVARVAEAVSLREAGITHPMVVLEGFVAAPELEVLATRQLTPVVHHPGQVDLLEQAHLPAPLPVWLKVDSGMHRFGVSPGQTHGLVDRLRACAAVREVECVMTHLACADDRGSDATSRQLDAFATATTGLDCPRSVANSGGILGWPESRMEWVRPGIMLYGVSPFLNGAGADHDLRPVMTLRGRLLAVNHRRRGEAVGYGGTWQCPEDMPVGIVGVGYGDGYPRHASAGTPVLVNGCQAPLVGRVSMDTLCVDLRGVPEARGSDPVVLWGAGLPVETVADQASTIAYELLCRLTPRVEFVERP